MSILLDSQMEHLVQQLITLNCCYPKTLVFINKDNAMKIVLTSIDSCDKG